MELEDLSHSPDGGRYIRMQLLAPITAGWFGFSVGLLGLPVSHGVDDSDILGHLQYHLTLITTESSSPLTVMEVRTQSTCVDKMLFI